MIIKSVILGNTLYFRQILNLKMICHIYYLKIDDKTLSKKETVRSFL